MRTIKRPPIISNLQEVIRNKEKRNSYTFTYKYNGESYYTIGDTKLTADKFNLLFPVEFQPANRKFRDSDKARLRRP
jgi:hypothetical protein